MKKIVLLVFCATMAAAGSAQITITRTDIANAGDWFYMLRDTAPAPAAATLKGTGSNYTWDASGIIRQQQKDTVYIADGTTYPNAPAGCNLVELYRGNDPVWMMAATASLKQMFEPGDVISSAGAITLLKFPSVMAGFFKDSIRSKEYKLATEAGFPADPSYDSVQISFLFSNSAVFDGYGKLINLTGQYDVLRQKSTGRLNIDFAFRSKSSGQYNIPFPQASIQSVRTVYAWYGQHCGYPLMRLFVDTSGNVEELWMMRNRNNGMPNGLGVISAASILSVYPNPVADVLTMEADSKTETASRLVVRDLMGSEVLPPTTQLLLRGNNTLSLDVHALRAGIYFYSLTGDGVVASGKFVVK